MSWYIQDIKIFFDFSGRARRKEYWIFSIISAIISVILGFVDGFIGFNLLTGLYGLFVLIPEISLQFRRLHDIDKSAWWLLLLFVPVIGAIVILVFAFLPGTAGPNKYGIDPKSEIIE